MEMRNYSVLIFLVLAAACVGCGKKPDRSESTSARTEETLEPHRPLFHFTPDSMWMNDPNGMVYFDGVYHLFYQHYPDSTVWGPMHWGHATSTDMVRWDHQPIALYPDELGYIFSGSAVVDYNNSSGFGTNDNSPLVAIFTYHNPVFEKESPLKTESQGIAFSLDKGKNWTKYNGNPVLLSPGIKDFRDPKGALARSLGTMDHVTGCNGSYQFLHIARPEKLDIGKRIWQGNWCAWWRLGVPRPISDEGS
jgi:fructan beta-fructosidase